MAGGQEQIFLAQGAITQAHYDDQIAKINIALYSCVFSWPLIWAGGLIGARRLHKWLIC
jgi:hypothetical protein